MDLPLGSSPDHRPLRVAWLYPQPKRDFLEACRRGEEPDQLSGIDAIRTYGVEPTLIDPNPPPLNPLGRRHSLYSGIDPVRALALTARLARFDVVLSVGEASALVVLMAKRLLRLMTPVVIWDPGLTDSWRLRRRVLDVVLPAADRVLVVSRNQLDWLDRTYGGRVTAAVAYHWMDTGFYRPEPAVRGTTILSVGNDPARDFATLIAAHRGLSPLLVLKTRNLSPDQVPAGVTTIPQRIHYQQLRQLYRDALIVVVPLKPSLHAGGVTGILEAAAMGKPAIVSDVDNIRDFVVPGETALMVPPGDPGALRQAIERLAADPAERARLGANARRFVEDRFSLDAFARGFAAELRQAARMPAAAGRATAA